jgi:poly-gamma-glutamate capsule biosynthesis protein CapA/YwtB (metallophosphatase superfamily)
VKQAPLILIMAVSAIALGGITMQLRGLGVTAPLQSVPAIVEDSTITVTAVGDIMMGSTFPEGNPLPAHDGADLFRETTHLLRRGDLVFGNLEGPLLDGGSTTKCLDDTANCFAFRMPGRYVAHLKSAGFSVVSTANNHALDFGAAGRANTVRLLDSAGIAHSGAVGDVAQLTLRGLRVAVIAFSYDDDSNNLNRLDKAAQSVRRLKKQNDLVFVSFHGGAEGAKYQHVPDSMEIFLREHRGHLRKFAHAVIDEGADLVIGHGPHVVRGMELYKHRLIAYSLGNFATYGRFNLNGPNGISCILEARLTRDGSFVSGQVHPVKQTKPGGPLPDAERKVIPILQRLSREDFGNRGVLVGEDGQIYPPGEKQ